ncbi:subtilisin-like protease SBT4.2 isoform X2 [Malus sylvestris]|nr:subtilisin-like protease SBT4.2 isoform X2 [Malus sylvestris]
MEGPYCVFGVTLPDGVYSPLSQHLRVLQRVIGPGRYVVVSVLLNRKFKLQTTRSSEFMGLSDKVTGNATIESDIIVVVIGSGIWPESKSFKTNVLVLLPKGGKNWDSGRNSCANHFSHFHVSFSKYLNLDKLANSMGDGTEVLDVQAAAKLLDTRQEKKERELEIESSKLELAAPFHQSTPRPQTSNVD